MPCDSCATFTIEGSSCTVYLHKPQYDGESNNISKEMSRFNFWSGNYAIHDNGINTQPLSIDGIEFICGESDKETGFCFSTCDGTCGARFPLYFKQAPYMKTFRFIQDMMENHEEVTISGLGDCMDAVYIIKSFTFKTLTAYSHSWNMILEKVR